MLSLGIVELIGWIVCAIGAVGGLLLVIFVFAYLFTNIDELLP